MKQTRRGVIKHLSGVIAGTGIVDTVNGAYFDRNKAYQNQSKDYDNMVTSRTNDADMFVTLPGVSLSTLIMNLPQLVYTNESVSPIVIDKYDWERLRGQIVTREDDYQAQRLGLMFNQLHRQGAIELFDYRKHYSQSVQRKNIEQTRDILSSLSEHENRNAARQSASGFIDYGLGPYQESLRESLDNLDRYVARRRWVEQEKENIESGTGDPEMWNERVINQYMAALEVRRNLHQKLGCDIKCIGQQESTSVVALLDGINHNDLPYTAQHSTDSLSDAFFEFDVDGTTKRREVADQISSIVRDVVGSDNENWFVFGPRLALLESGDTYLRARSHLRFNSLDSVVTEARDLLSRLQKEREDNRTTEFAKSEIEWLKEEHNLNHIDKRRIRNQLEAETTLTNYSRDLDALGQDYSPAARTVVESIVMDPMNRYTEDAIYREAIDLMRMLEPVHLTDDQLETFMHRGAFRRGDDEWDWYQDVDRQPITS